MTKLKKVLTIIGVSSIAILPFVTVGGWGCANNTPNTVAYKGYSSGAVGIQTAMGFWDAYLESSYNTTDTNKIATLKSQEVKVKGFYEKWQSAMALAADAGAVWSAAAQGGTNATVSGSALAAFSQAVNNAAATQTDLQNAIATFSGKPLPTQ